MTIAQVLQCKKSKSNTIQVHHALHTNNVNVTHQRTSVLFSMQIEYWILTCKVLAPIPAISAYSAIFPPSSAAIWCSVANHQVPPPLYAQMCRCADVRRCVFHMDPTVSGPITTQTAVIFAVVALITLITRFCSCHVFFRKHCHCQQHSSATFKPK